MHIYRFIAVVFASLNTELCDVSTVSSSAAAAVTQPSDSVMQAPCPSPVVASHPAASAAYQHSLTTHDNQNVSEAAQMKHDKDSIYGYDNGDLL